MTRRAWACLLFACVALLARDGGAVRAQPRPVQIQPGQPQPVFAAGGTDIFRALLAREGFTPVTRNEAQWMRFDSNVAVVVIGNGWADVREPFGSVRDAVRNDGAGLIALDSQVALASARNGNRVAARVSGAAITAAAQDGHNNRADCPYAVPLSPEEFRPRIENPGPVFGLFRGLPKVATNEPSDIRIVDQFVEEFAYPLARHPKSAMVNGFRPAGNQPPLLAIGGDGPRNRPDDEAFAFLAVADSSIFINQMMLEPGTDNFQFAERVAKYLKGPERRTRCLFFENGRIVEDFNSLREALTPQAPPLPQNKVPNLGPLIGKNQDKLVKLIDDKIDEVQRKDLIHKIAMGEQDSPRERSQFAKAITVMLVFLSVRLCLMLLFRTGHAKHPTDIPHPPTTGAGAASTGPTGVFDRRRRELMRRNNVFDPVSHLMREFFLSTGVAADLGPRIPRVWVTDSVRRPDSLRQAVRDMWRIAFGPPVPLSAQRWFEIEPYFDRLRQAYADGKWKFVLPE